MSHAQFVHEFLLGSTTDPHAPAVHDLQGRCVRTFAELEVEARLIAADLDRLSVVGGDRALLKLRPTPEAIATICACSMNNTVFVPVDPDAPEDRIRTIIDLAEPTVVIEAADDEQHVLPGSPSAGMDGGQLRATRAGPSGVPLAPLETSDAYIVFTSGTTGRPKGICMSHRATLTFWRGLIERCPVPASGRVGSVSPLHFDLSLLDLGLALGCGAGFVQLDRRLLMSPRQFLSAMTESGITQLNCVPSVWRILLRHVPDKLADITGLRSTLFAGELFPIEELRQLGKLRPDLELINCFGQSESIACSFLILPRPLPDAPSPPIGPAIQGADMILVDQAGCPVTRVGAVGELYLRGGLLFSGYWRDPEATARALLPNPLRPLSPERVFRTGDLLRRGPQGTFLYAGRRDLQVQVLGNRVELEEIERCLDDHDGVAEVGVYAHGPDGNTRLVALVVRRRPGVDAEEVRRFCASRLPAYMVPAEVRFVESLPRTLSGKLDRTQLDQY